MPGKPENSALKLLSSRKTLVMATADKDGAPNVSYAPFVHRAPPLYVFTSSRSRHTRNMMETAKASVMFIEDEVRTKNFFARKRFTCQCMVELVERETTEWRTVMSLFKRKFGKVFDMILPLPDFALFRLVPDGGLYVRGFGQAFEISPDMKNSKHVTGNSPVQRRERTMKTPIKAATTTAASAALATLLTMGVPSVSAAATFVYVSDADDATIDAYAMDMRTGGLTSMGKAEAGKTVMPMAVAPDKKFLYAVVRSQPTRVLTYAIDSNTGALTPKATAPLPGSMAYVSTDRSGRFLFTASYGGDKVAVSPIEADGLVTAAAIQVMPTGRNAHSILVDHTNRFAYLANLGANQVLQFAFDAKTGKLTPLDPPAVKPEPGHGPRHLAFSPDNRFLYVLNELSGYVTQYAIDGTKGTLKLVDSVPSVPVELGMKWGKPQPPAGTTPTAPVAEPKAGETPPIWAADLRLTPNGKFLYTTERNTDKIALFTVASDTGKLSYVTNFGTERQPRGINIDPSGQYLVASGEKSDQLSVYRIDQASGKLGDPTRYPVGKGANWIEIVEVK